MGKQKSIQNIPLALNNELKPKLHDGADIGLKMGVCVACIEWWIPDLNRQDVHGPEKLAGILCWENPEEIATMKLPLFQEIVSTR
jgi:hypothetical protein